MYLNGEEEEGEEGDAASPQMPRSALKKSLGSAGDSGRRGSRSTGKKNVRIAAEDESEVEESGGAARSAKGKRGGKGMLAGRHAGEDKEEEEEEEQEQEHEFDAGDDHSMEAAGTPMSIISASRGAGSSSRRSRRSSIGLNSTAGSVGQMYAGRSFEDSEYQPHGSDEDDDAEDEDEDEDGQTDADSGGPASGPGRRTGRGRGHAGENDETQVGFANDSFAAELGARQKKRQAKRKRREEAGSSESGSGSSDEHSDTNEWQRYAEASSDEDADEEDEEDADEFGNPLRRSRRKTKNKTWDWWANARPVYRGGQLIGHLQAEEAQKQERKAAASRKKRQRKQAQQREEHREKGEIGPLMRPIPPTKGREYQTAEPVWLVHDREEGTREEKVLKRWQKNSARAIAGTKVKAFTAFRVAQRTSGPDEDEERDVDASGRPIAELVLPSIITGTMVLPPGVAKDAECVGSCAQLFNVCSCQPQAVEIGLSAAEDGDDVEAYDEGTARYALMSTGDSFYVPPDNTYHVHNRSKTEDAVIFYTLVRKIGLTQNDCVWVEDGTSRGDADESGSSAS